jgi:FkbH-like protein
MEEIATPASANDLNAVFTAVSRLEREARFDHVARVVLLRNITIEGLDTFLKFHLYSSAIRAEVVFGGYGTMMQDALADDGPFRKGDPDLVVLSLTLDDLDPAYGTPGWRAEAAQSELKNLFELLERRTRATIVVNTFISPLYPESGLVPAPDCSDATSQISALNRFVQDFVRERAPRFCLADWDRYLRILGAKEALDHRCHHLWKAPFKKAFLNLYAQDLSRIVRALRGCTKKCLVLDCDNTLWGGIVGEDGIDGIKLDRNEYPGKVFHAFHNSLLHLAERGVLIALCSKNNEADVFEVMDKHPWCRLKRSHLAAWRINWQDKTENIVELAEELNLGLDSLVFIDDNPVERDLVRKVLPDVTVLQVPEKLYDLPSLVFELGLFDNIRLTDEDKRRTRLYQSESQRKAACGAFKSVDEYLASLQTVASIHRVRPAEIARVAQLTQKTNQFNLTTRRYSERDIEALAERQDAAAFSLSVHDRYGDLGLVGVMVLERNGVIGRIDTCLMSCRALGRGLERAMVARCLDVMGRAWDVQKWQAEYIPTRKNMQVADFWTKNGFVPMGERADRKTYVRDAREGGGAIPAYICVQED